MVLEVPNYELENLRDYIYEKYESTANRPIKGPKDLETYTEMPISSIKRITAGIKVDVDTACRFILSFPLCKQELIECLSLCLGVDLQTKVYGYFMFAIKRAYEEFPIPLEYKSQEYYKFRSIEDCKARREFYDFVIANKNKIKPKYLPRNNALN